MYHQGTVKNHHEDKIEDNSSDQSFDDKSPKLGNEHLGAKKTDVPLNVDPSVMKYVSNTIEEFVADDLDSEIQNLPDIDPSAWEAEAYNISKLLFDKYHQKIEQNLREFLRGKENTVNFPLPCEGENESETSEPSKMTLTYFNEAKESIIESRACHDIVHCIGNDKNTDVRLKYLNILVNLQSFDDIDCDSWMDILKKLKKNLTDESSEIFSITLQIHSNLASSMKAFFLQEAVKNLVEHLYYQYHFKKFPHLEINVGDEISRRTVYIFLTLIDILKHIGHNCMRVSDKILHEVLSCFVNLIFVHPYNLTDLKQIYQTETLCPYAFLSALDPNASWLTRLLFNVKSRQVAMSVLKENRKFFRHKIEQVFEWFQLPDTSIPIPAERQAATLGSVKLLTIKYAMVIHTISMFSHICQYNEGKEMFVSFCSEHKSINYESFVRIMVHFLQKFQEFEKIKTTFFSEKLIDTVTDCVVKMLPTENKEPLKLILVDIFAPLRSSENISKPYAEFLNKVFDSPSVVAFIIAQSSSHNFSSDRTVSTTSTNSSQSNSSRSKRSNSGCESVHTAKSDKSFELIVDENISVKVIVQYVHVYMNTHSIEDLSVIEKLLKIVLKFFIQPDTLILLYSYLHSIIFDVFQLTSLLTQNFGSTRERCHNAGKSEEDIIKRVIKELLQSILCSPIGMPFLDRKGLPADIFCKDFQTDNAYQWNAQNLRLFVFYAINCKKSLDTLIQYNYFTIRPFQSLLQSEAFYMTGFTTTQKEIYRAFMSIIFIISLSSEAFKEIVSQIKEPDAEDSILNLEEELNRVSVLYIIPCNLFYYSDSQSIFHFIALSALRVLFQNIDICICLSLKFNLQGRMTDMENFATNNFKKSREIIIDECSLLRNELNNLSCCPGIYSSSLTHSESLQSEQKFKTAVQKRKQLNDLNKFLFDTKKGLHDLGWLKNLRKTFLSTLKDEVKCSTVLDIVEQVSKCGGYLASKSIQWSLLEKKYLSKLSKFDEMAVSLVLRYGEKNNLLNENKDNKENFVQFLSRCETYFTPPPENFVQFDWFSATVFLVCSGNIDRSLQILSFLSAFPSTVYSWLQLAEKRGQSWSMFGQLIEWLLSVELPKIYFLFQTKGVSWWLVYQSWMRQCFLNQLQWNEILQWILLIVLYPVDYQIYYSISVLKCSQESLLLSDQNDNFFDALMGVMHNYHLGDQARYLNHLHKKYSTFLSQNLQFTADYI